MSLEPDGGVAVTASPSGELSLAVDRLRSGNRLEDRELHRRIDSGRFPTIVGVLRKMEPSGVARDVPGEWRHHVSGRDPRARRPDATSSVVDGHTIEVGGTSRFDIREFGMDPPRLLMARVEPEVEIRIHIVAVEES